MGIRLPDSHGFNVPIAGSVPTPPTWLATKDRKRAPSSEWDARNLAERETEDYTPEERQPPKDDPGRCRRWDAANRRPCREWGLMTLDGTRIDACEGHSGARTSILLQSTLGASHRAKHLAYSAVADAFLDAALRRVEDDAIRKKAEEVLDIMRAADAQADDPVLGMRRVVSMLVAKIEVVNRMWLTGKIGEDDHANALVMLAEQLRKLHKTRHDITGTISDENDAAITAALRELELDGDGMYSAVDDAPDGAVDEREDA